MSKAVWNYGNELFSKSMITSSFLKQHNINMKVKDFIEYIKTQPYRVVAVGGFTENYKQRYKHIKVWNIIQIKYKLSQKDL